MAIVVTTPTGNIGSRVVERLLEAGAEVAVIARHPERLPEGVRARARVHRGSSDDPKAVIEATEGAEALFWLTPPSLSDPDPRAYYDRFRAAAVAALEANGVPRVVHLSSFGAQKPAGVGLISFVGATERSLDAAAAAVLHLRAGSFFENYLPQADAIRRDGAIYQPMPGPARVPMIATRDIGDVAAAKLLDRSWSGRSVLGLHGPADLSFDEAAEILGRAVGKPVHHVQITPEQARQFLAGAGASAAWIDRYLEMVAGFTAPDAVAEPRTPETTTPTTLAEWAAEVLAPIVRG